MDLGRPVAAVFLALCVWVLLCACPTEGASRHKRDLLELEGLLSALTHRSGLAYNNYGCYCGWGGSGTPKDEIDACCQAHDNCYGKYESCWPKFRYYQKRLQMNVVTDGKTLPVSAECTDPLNNCAYNVCQCDKTLAECIEASASKYNPKLKDYPKNQC